MEKVGGTRSENQTKKSFTYNLLNLPLVATIPAGTATYTYDANGNKLRKVDVLNGVTTATDYINGIQYGPNTGFTTISFIQTEEGKAERYGTGYDYTYYLGDNLGNTRITFDTKTGSAVTEQTDDYYPFGLEISRGTITSPKNEYLYNRKELQEELGEYDYGARFYDPVIARWHVIDAYAEHPDQINLSPYVYVGDSPIDKTDPDGNCPPCDGPSPAAGIFFGGLAIGGGMIAVAAPTGVGEVIAAPAAVVEVTGATVIAGGVALWGIIAHHFGSHATEPTPQNTPDRTPPQPATVQPPTIVQSSKYGSKGNPDHQKQVKDLADQKTAEHPDKQVIQEKKIRTDGSNRIPDIQVVNPQTGKVEEVHEVERHPNRARNKKREAEYNDHNIPNQTHPLKTTGT